MSHQDEPPDSPEITQSEDKSDYSPLEDQERGAYLAYPGYGRKYVAYTIKLPGEQLAALQSIWLELKRMYGTHSPDKSGMIQQAVAEWLRRWDGPDREELLSDLLAIREETRFRQYKKVPSKG